MNTSIQDGLHPARCVNFEHGTSKQNGTDFVRLTFRISDGPARWRYVAWDGFLTEAALERTLEQLGFCGWDGRSLQRLAGVDTKEVLLDIVNEENPEKRGQFFPRVNWIRRAGTRPLSQERTMTAERLSALDARYGEFLKKPQGNAAGPNDDDFGPMNYDE